MWSTIETGAENGSSLQKFKIANISAIGNGSWTECTIWDCFAWQDLNADDVHNEVCAVIEATLPWFKANRPQGNIVWQDGHWNKEHLDQEWMEGIIRMKDDVDDQFELTDCDLTFDKNSLWTRTVIEFHDLVNQYKHVVAFGSPHADVDDIQIQKA